MNNIYDNWKIITETDFVTLFIKTWFAYIATLRKMFPEDYNRQGDKKYLNSYKEYYNLEGYKKLTIDDVLMQEMELIYKEGRSIILKYYPEYYFDDFYKINTNLKYIYKDTLPDESEGLIISIKHKGKGVFSYIVFFGGKVRNQKYNKKIKGRIDFNRIILNQNCDLNQDISEFEYMSKIFNEFQLQIIGDIESKINQKIELEKIKSIKSKFLKIKEKINNNIISLVNMNTKLISDFSYEDTRKLKDEYCFLEQVPFNYFLYFRENSIFPSRNMESVEKQYFNKMIEKMRINSINWFLDFIYRLRNALFHEIIDPFDEEWQCIFKNSYLVLKELVEINIDYLKGKENG